MNDLDKIILGHQNLQQRLECLDNITVSVGRVEAKIDEMAEAIRVLEIAALDAARN